MVNLIKSNLITFKFRKKTRQQIYKIIGIPNLSLFCLALAVAELLAILCFFAKEKWQNISGNHAAT